MSKQKPPAKRVYARHGRWYYVDTGGTWRPLTRQDAGLPAMFKALAALLDTAGTGDLMPAVITRWASSKEDAGEWEASTKRNMDRVTREVAEEFQQVHPASVDAPICFRYLKRYLSKPRTYNLHRSVIRQVLSFAALEGLRSGHNPVDDVPQRKMAKRERIVTDAEVKAIKAAALDLVDSSGAERRKDGKPRRGGQALCQMIDLALLTGQRIGDVIKMRWQDVTTEGVLVKQKKTGQQLLIEWSPALLTVVDSCAEGTERIGFLLKKSTGAPYRYAGIRSAWDRACAKAGVEDLHIHDLRGRAGADRAEEDGIYEAQKLLGHESVVMTEGYVRGKKALRAKATGGG